MTAPNYPALLLSIDSSGSMTSIRDDMAGGLTTILAKQAAQHGMLTEDIVTVDDEIEVEPGGMTDVIRMRSASQPTRSAQGDDR